MSNIYIGKKHLDHFDFVSYDPCKVYGNQDAGETEYCSEIKFSFLQRYAAGMFGKEYTAYLIIKNPVEEPFSKDSETYIELYICKDLTETINCIVEPVVLCNLYGDVMYEKIPVCKYF